MYSLKLIAAFLLVIVQTTLSQFHGQECTSRICSESRGHIVYTAASRTKPKIWSIITPNYEFSTIVLQLQDIHLSHIPSTPWLKIYVQRRKTVDEYEIMTGEERILSFKDANEVIVEVSRNDYVQFQLNYFVGCAIYDNRDVEIEKKRVDFHKLFSQESAGPRCWFIFPVTREQQMFYALRQYYRSHGFPSLVLTRDVSAKEAHLTFSGVSLTNGSGIKVYSFLTGKLLASVKNNEKFYYTAVEESEKEVNYTNRFMMKQAFFVDLDCPNNLQCKLAQFNFRAYGMKQSDLNCVEKQIKCLYNFGERNYSCSPRYLQPEKAFQELTSRELTTTSCPAFNYLSETVLEEYKDLSPKQRSQRPKLKNKKRKTCQSYRRYCRKPCSLFSKNNCDRICIYFKRLLCKKQQVYL